MNSRILGKTGLAVSEVGFGAWAIGDAWGELVDEDVARQALHAAIESGVNLIDTADVYGAGRSESLIGEVLKERTELIYVATKMGRAAEWNDSYDTMAKAAEVAIDRLGVDALDLVQLHCIPTETLKAGLAFENLEKLKTAGLIKHYGVSIETIEEGLFCCANTDAATLQVIFNIFRQRVIEDLFPAVKAAGIGVLARVPLASGILTGKFDPDHQFHSEDHRQFNANGECFNVGETFGGVPFSTAVSFAKVVEQILALEAEEGTLAQKALRWVLDFPEVSSVIPGAKSPQQAQDNVGAADLPALGSEAHARLRKFYDEEIDAAVRGVY